MPTGKRIPVWRKDQKLMLLSDLDEPIPELRFCNKCGYHGTLKDHPGCDYDAYPVKPEAPHA